MNACRSAVVVTLMFLAGCGSEEIVYVNNMDTAPVVAGGTEKAAVTAQQAIDIAVRHAGFANASDVQLKKCELDHEWGTQIYEIEFKHGWYEYEYDVEVATGKILKMKKDFD